MKSKILIVLFVLSVFMSISFVSAVDGDSYDNYSNGTSTITPEQTNTDTYYRNTSVKVDDVNARVGDEVNLTANVVDEKEEKVTGGKVLFKINGETIRENDNPVLTDVVDGRAVLGCSVAPSWLKNISIEAVYKPTENYSSSRNTTYNVFISQVSTDTLVANISSQVGKNVTLMASIVADNDKPVNEGKVVFKINNESFKVDGSVVYARVVNSTASIDCVVPYTWRRNVTLDAVYSGSKTYDSSRSNTAYINMTPYYTNVTLDDDIHLVLNKVTQLVAHVTTNGTPVSEGRMIFKVNGATIKNNGSIVYVNVVNGLAVLNYTVVKSWLSNDLDIQAVYEGNYVYNASRSNIVHIDKHSIAYISADNSTRKSTDIVYMKVNVTDSLGSSVGDGSIKVYINNTEYGSSTLNNGFSKVYLGKLDAGSYDVRIDYESELYQPSSRNFKLDVLKGNSSVKLVLDIPSACANGTKLELRAYATFTNTSLERSVDDGYVDFYINNKFIKTVELSYAKALYKYTMPHTLSKYVIDAYYHSAKYGDNTSTATISVTTKDKLNKTNTAIKGNKNPFNTSIALVDGRPDVSLMTNFVWADENATYTLSKSQYQEVTIRDSYTLFLNNYMSKYVFFKTVDEPDVYHVLRRQKWNVIERMLNTRLVLSYGGAYPENITANLKGKEYTYSEVRDIQNTSYTCGPTSLSICSQALKTYISEYRLSKDAKSDYNTGTATSNLRYASTLHNMTSTYFYNTSFDVALEELSKGACALVFHTWSHYVAIIDINKDKNMVLVVNPSGGYDNGSHQIPTKWLSVDYMRNRFNDYDTSGLIVKLNYNLSSDTSRSINYLYHNMAPKYNRGNTSERVPNTG